MRRGAQVSRLRKKVRVEKLAGGLENQRRLYASWGAQYAGAGHTVVTAQGYEFIVGNWSPSDFDALEYLCGREIFLFAQGPLVALPHVRRYRSM